MEKNETWAGVQHNEDLGYIFGLPLSTNSIFANRTYDKKFGAADKSMSRFMMRLVGEFVRSGVPVVQGLRGRVCWDSVETGGWGEVPTCGEFRVVSTRIVKIFIQLLLC